MPVGGVFELIVLKQQPGRIVARIKGRDSFNVLKNEAGGHRWQRMPPNDSSGRVHTSTITVAVLPDKKPDKTEFNKEDFEITTTCGSGPGGQHKNKVETCVIVKHKESGLTAKCQDSKSQKRNKEKARSVIAKKLKNNKMANHKKSINNKRKKQVGTGMRGDKRRTISVKRNKVVDHINKTKTTVKDYLKGKLGKLHK